MVNYILELNLAEIVRGTPFMSTISGWILGSGVTSSTDMAVVGVFVSFYWTGAMVGRFLGAYLTQLFKPSVFLEAFAIGAILMLMVSNISLGLLAMWTMIGVGLFNSIMFPTIFSLALEDLGNDKPQGSGILCTMIVGGAIIPPVYGFLVDTFSFSIALIFLMFCYSYILFYGIFIIKEKREIYLH